MAVFGEKRICLIIILLLLLCLLWGRMLTFLKATKSTSIQELINSAEPGSTVVVPSGIYYENNIEINKSIILRAEEPLRTIVDGAGEIFPIFKVLASNVKIEGFIVRNTDPTWESYGIILKGVSNVTIRGNNFTKCYYGVVIEESNNCKIIDNAVVSNYASGLVFRSGASYNLIARNFIYNNSIGVFIYDSNCRSNIFFHNNFIYNKIQVSGSYPYNKFDNGFEGNYWSDYQGADLDKDGLGDNSYMDIDNFPLMGFFYIYRTENGECFEIISNSTITAFNYSILGRELRINLKGKRGTLGFCRICIPLVLISPPYTVKINGSEMFVRYINTSIYSNGTHQWIYFNYIHSEWHEVVIIPEYSICYPIFLSMLLTCLFVKKRENHRSFFTLR